jgi:putative endopeptidase
MHMINRRLMISSGAASLWLAAAAAPRMVAAVEAGSAPHGGASAASGLDLSGMDRRVRAGDDFFRFMNGGWLDRTIIPADRSSVGIDQQLEDTAQDVIRAILDAHVGPEQTDLAKAQSLYRLYLDEDKLNALGASPVAGTLAAIRAVSTPEALAAFMGATHRALGGSLFQLSIRPDLRNPERYAVVIQQNGLGLPDRAYYLDGDFAEVRDSYQAYVSRLLTRAGWDAPAEAAAAVLGFETAIAEASWDVSRARDLAKTYNPTEVADLGRSSAFPWMAFLASAGLGRVQRVILGQPDAVRSIADLALRTSPATLRAWAATHVLNEASAYLSSEFAEAREAFQEGVLTGVTDTPPRWRRGLALVDTLMGDAVGKVYVERALEGGTRPAVQAMFETLRTAFSARLDRLEWMSPSGKALAREKLTRMGAKLAYPDAWRSYERVTIRAGDLFGSVLSARAADWDRRVERLDGPTVRGEWFMTPQTPNAAYSVSLNEVLVTAAELQPPFFQPGADAAANYGAIGAIIGHEMTHGFDDDGRSFDAAGRLTRPWNSGDTEAFERESSRLASQLDATEALPGTFLDGRLTLNEAIADLGGAHIAFDAYHLSLGGHAAPVIDGLSGDQRFFLAFAQAWRWKEREAALRSGLASDSHAPPHIRVNGTVRNMDAWYDAFSVGADHALFLPPEQRVRLW